METHSGPGVKFAERLDGGVVVTFEDGRSALFSAALLYAALPEAEELFDDPTE